jgi:hypothetical protein
VSPEIRTGLRRIITLLAGTAFGVIAYELHAFEGWGLNSGVKWPVSGSREPRSEPLKRLQSKHASARFDSSVAPPCFTATM